MCRALWSPRLCGWPGVGVTRCVLVLRRPLGGVCALCARCSVGQLHRGVRVPWPATKVEAAPREAGQGAPQRRPPSAGGCTAAARRRLCWAPALAEELSLLSQPQTTPNFWKTFELVFKSIQDNITKEAVCQVVEESKRSAAGAT